MIITANIYLVLTIGQMLYIGADWILTTSSSPIKCYQDYFHFTDGEMEAER